MTVGRAEVVKERSIRVASGCWEWQSTVHHTGYGVIDVKGRQYRAHRYAYEAFKGPIPDGLLVLHSCDNKRCVNPEHLRVGTNSDNMKDAVARGQHPRLHGEAHSQAKLTERQVLSIRRRYAAGGVTQQELAAEFGVTFQMIHRIIARKAWTHV